MTSMRIHVRNCGRLTGSTGRRYGGWLGSSPCRRVRTKRRLPTSHHAYLPLHPSPQRRQRFTGTHIVGARLLKEQQHPFCMGGGFQRQRMVNRQSRVCKWWFRGSMHGRKQCRCQPSLQLNVCTKLSAKIIATAQSAQTSRPLATAAHRAETAETILPQKQPRRYAPQTAPVAQVPVRRASRGWPG